MHTIKLRYNFLKVALAQNIIGEVSFKVAKKGWLAGQQQKTLQFFHRASFMKCKNEENIMDKPYTSISSKLPCVVCLYFFKTPILTIFMNLCARDNRLLGI